VYTVSYVHIFFWIFLKNWNLNFLEIQKKGSIEPMCQNDALDQTQVIHLAFRHTYGLEILAGSRAIFGGFKDDWDI
jgi:hypothetical protein